MGGKTRFGCLPWPERPLLTFWLQLVLVEWGLWGNPIWITKAKPCSTPEHLAAAGNTTKVQVLLPSIGQSGTTSVCDALRLMGYRVFHIEETSLFARGANVDNLTVEAWAQAVSQCRLQVISLEPTTDLLPVALAASPDTKVILTWRDWESLAKSSKEGGVFKDVRWGILWYFTSQSCRGFPWLGLWDHFTGDITRVIEEGKPFVGAQGTGSFATFMFYNCYKQGYALKENDMYNRGVFKVYQYEEAYLAHQSEIRRMVPPDRLFEFDVRRHGWTELSRFLGRPIPAGKNASSGLPHSRSKASFTNDAVFDHNPTYAAMCVAILASLHIINMSIWGCFWRLCGSLWRLIKHK